LQWSKHSTGKFIDMKMNHGQAFLPNFSVTKSFGQIRSVSAIWTAAARCSFPLHSLLWTTGLKSDELSSPLFGSRLPALKRQQAAAVQRGAFCSKDERKAYRLMIILP
jgi:methionine salvage enolase-phosphatase E1